MSLKLPSLDTAEGVVVLGLAAFVVYIAYKSAKGVQNLVIQPLKNAAAAVGKAVTAVVDAVPGQADFAQAQDNMRAVGDSGIDGTAILPLPTTSTDGLGTQGNTSALPQLASPAPFAVNMSDLTPGGW